MLFLFNFLSFKVYFNVMFIIRDYFVLEENHINTTKFSKLIYKVCMLQISQQGNANKKSFFFI